MHAARAGRLFVAAELNRRGADRVEISGDHASVDLTCASPDGRQLEFIIRSRRSGDWQTRASLGAPRSEDPGETRFWAFVDLGADWSPPSFYIAPAWWVVNDIYSSHAEYLERHGGQRARTPSSDHHRITLARIEPWRDMWSVLGLDGHAV